jgi:hypothetical protein
MLKGQERSVEVQILKRWLASQFSQLGTPLGWRCRVW